MSQGSYGTQSGVDLGTAPVHMSAWDKFQLGWLNYDVAGYGQSKEVKLGPAETNTKQAQGVFTLLPDKQKTTTIGSLLRAAISITPERATTLTTT